MPTIEKEQVVKDTSERIQGVNAGAKRVTEAK